MNIIYETTKERGATILIPTSMVDSMSVALPAAMLAQQGPGRAGRLVRRPTLSVIPRIAAGPQAIRQLPSIRRL